jgi:hypothetical protein
MPVSSALFKQLEADVWARLASRGFVLQVRELNGPFGSHYTEYRRSSAAIRIVADNKEDWLLLEFSQNHPDNSEAWEDLSLQRAVSSSRKQYKAAFEAILEALELKLA